MDDLPEHLEVHAEPQLKPALVDAVVAHPHQRIVELRIDRLNIFGCQLLVQHPLVERHGEAAVDEAAVVERHGDEAPDELEVLQMVGIDIARRVDLQRVVGLVGVLEQAVHGIQHLVRQQEEPFAAHPAVVQAFLAAEDDVKAPAQLVSRESHDLVVRVLEQRLAGQRDLNVARQGVGLTQVTELTQLPAEASLIGARHAVNAFGALRSSRPRILERRSPRVVIHEEAFACRRVADLPAGRQRALAHQAHLLALRARILPLRRSVLVVHEVNAKVGLHPLLPAVGQRAQAIVVVLRWSLRCVARLRMLRVQEPLVALRHHVRALSLPVRELHQPLAVRTLPGGGSRVVIDVVNASSRIPSDFPSGRQRTRLLPVRWSRVVVDIVATAVGIGSTLPAGGKRLVVGISVNFPGKRFAGG